MAGPPHIPVWLLEVKSGVYSLDEFVQFSEGKVKKSIHIKKRIHMMITRLKMPKKIGPLVYGNIVGVKYEWNNPHEKEVEK